MSWQADLAEQFIQEIREQEFDAGMRTAIDSAVELLKQPNLTKEDVIKLLEATMQLRTALQKEGLL